MANVKNRGAVSTRNGFFTDLYIDHLPTGTGDYSGSVRFWVNNAIEPGATANLTTRLTDLPSAAVNFAQADAPILEKRSTLYAQVDSGGFVPEPDEANNVYAAGRQVRIAVRRFLRER